MTWGLRFRFEGLRRASGFIGLEERLRVWGLGFRGRAFTTVLAGVASLFMWLDGGLQGLRSLYQSRSLHGSTLEL